MPQTFSLTLQDHNKQEHKILYRLADNPIASQWFKKIQHLSRVPLDRDYTSTVEPDLTQKEQNQKIKNDIILLCEKLGPVSPVKDVYDQQDCNTLHKFTVENLHQYEPAVREILHRLHRSIHRYERLFHDHYFPIVHVGWGEKEGLLTGTFKEPPYQYYHKDLKEGFLYMMWNEFGKTPYHFWLDQDNNTPEHFNQTCKPQTTFRAQFIMAYEDYTNVDFEPEFEVWFDQYRDQWQEQYGIGWTTTLERGGVFLAEPVDPKHNFHNTCTVLSVDLVN